MSAPRPIDGVHALVLAAGAGRRFGGRKLLAPWRGAPLLHAALSAACAAPVEAVVVVVGAEAERICDAARAFRATRPLRLVLAPAWEDGLSASLRAGVAALPAEARAALVFLGDMPRIPTRVLSPLVEAIAAGAEAAAPVFEGRRGHPVALGRRLLDRVDCLTGDAGARSLLDEVEVAEVAAESDGILFDVDAPDALVQAQTRP